MRTITWGTLALLAVPATHAYAQAPAGPEFRVNSNTGTRNDYPSVASHTAGDFVVVWSAYANGTVAAFARLFDAQGVPRGGELQVSKSLPYVALNTDVGFDASGRYVVVWGTPGTSGDRDVFGRRVDASGAPMGAEFRLNTFTTTTQRRPQVAVAPEGGFVAIWEGFDGSNEGLFGQRFDANGLRLGGEFAVNTSTHGLQYRASIAMDGNGNFLVVWDNSSYDRRLLGQRFSADGGRIGGEFQINGSTLGGSPAPVVTSAPDGRFVVAWLYSSTIAPARLFARMFDATGSPSGSEFFVHSFADIHFLPQLSATTDPSGAFILQWTDPGADGSLFGVEARRFDASGTPLGSAYQVNTTTTGDQWWAVISSDAAGNTVSAWLSPREGTQTADVYAQRFGRLGAAALAVDTVAGGSSDGNRVLEAGETVDLRPSWRNNTTAPQALPATLSSLTGAPGATYLVDDGVGEYGLVASGATQPCLDCYAIGVQAETRPLLHWDATATELIGGGGAAQYRWPVHIGGSFTDVPRSSLFYRAVETLLHRGVTSGCDSGTYCPASVTTREQMAAFVLNAREQPRYLPPRCVHYSSMFNDVDYESPFCRWIEELARRGITGGCGDGKYCPTAAVPREQMAVFLLRTLDPTLNPPECAPPNFFNDVPASSPFCRWIEELVRRGITGGCGGGNYCPAAPVTREQMAVFLTGTFDLTLYGP